MRFPKWPFGSKKSGPTAGDLFSSPTAAVLAEGDMASESGAVFTLAALMVILGVFICVVKLERVVVATGRLVPIAGGITVQPLETQIISKVLVKVGDVVHKGQVLAECDPTLVRADQTRVAQSVESLDAQLRRLTAEANEQAFSPLTNNSYDAMQAPIFDQRRTELASSKEDFDQRIASLTTQLEGLGKAIAGYKSRLKLGDQMANMHQELAKDGYVSKLQLLGVQDQQLELSRQLADAESQLESNTHLLDSLREQRKVFVGKWHDDNLNSMVSVRGQLDSARQDLGKAGRLAELANLVAPEDGVVTRIPNLTAGGVAAGAAPLFSLMPLNALLEVRLEIDARDIGFVRVGDPVTVKFDAFRFMEHGGAKGVITTISQDAFTTTTTQNSATAAEASRSAYYDARVSISNLQLRNIPETFKLIPGMSIAADIIVGHRTILWYILGGAIRDASEAMRER